MSIKMATMFVGMLTFVAISADLAVAAVNVEKVMCVSRLVAVVLDAIPNVVSQDLVLAVTQWNNMS